MCKSKVIICLLMGLIMCTNVFGATEKQQLNIVFIGNSITFGAGLPKPYHDAPPVKAALYLTKLPGVGSVKYSNRGSSGCTTVDYLPETNTLFPWAVRAADKFKDETWATLIFSITLGTNDSAMKGTNGCPVEPERYYANMKTIIDRLLALYPDCRIVMNRPLWYSPNTYNGAMYLSEGLKRLEDYYPQLQKLAEYYTHHFPGQVFVGDTDGFDYFKENYLTDFQPEDGNAGVFYLHPNAKGAVKLGEFWGKAIQRVIGE